ncbi:MAG: 3TM-type holin [Pseudomonadota bacterium]
MSIVSIIAEAALGPVLDVFRDLGGKWINKQISDRQFRTEVQKALLLALTNLWSEQGKVIVAEINSESPLTRLWRPVVAVSFAFVLFWYAFFVPIAVGWLGAPPLAVGDKLLEWIMTLLTISITGYIGGRSVEKVVDKFIRKG